MEANRSQTLPRTALAAELKSLAGWLLVAGFVLAAFGLVARSQGEQETDPPETTTGATTSLPISQAYGTADSNGSMIAVTGVDVTGGSLLYLIDTEGRHLSIYQATGGTKSTMNVKWVGARNIDLDLQVDGWNDKSDYPYKKLAEEFAGGGSLEDER